MVTERPTVLESWSGKKLGFFQVGSARGSRNGWRPVVVVRLSPSKMRAESKGVRAGSEAMHSDTKARKQATSTVPLSSVQPCQAEKGKSTSRSQSTVQHVYKSNYEIKDVRAAWKAMYSHTMVRKQSTSALEHVQVYRAQTGKSPSRGVVQERLRGKVVVLHGSKATVITACACRMAARKYVKQLREFLHAEIAKQGEHVRRHERVTTSLA